MAELAGRAYRLLASDAARSAGDPITVLADGLGIGDEQSRAVLDWLRERRLYGGTGAAGLTAPENAALELLGEVGGSLTRLVQDVARWQGSVADVTGLFAREVDGADPASVQVLQFTDKTELRRWLDERAPRNTGSAVMMHPVFPSMEVLRRSLDVDLDLLDRGVCFRMLASAAAARRPGVRSYLAKLQRAGAQIRISRAVPTQMMVIDGRLVVADVPGASAPTHVAIRSHVVGHCFTAVFDCLWNDAADYAGSAGFADDRPDEAAGLTSVQISLLKALANGSKDEAIARLLGCSERTLRRLVAQTLDDLGVRSRFAAGVRAARLGLLD